MVDQLAPLSVDDSQRITLPVWPDKFNVPLLLPEHIAVLPLTEPPTEPTLTVTSVVGVAVHPAAVVTVTV
jgi:hypothetical protein